MIFSERLYKTGITLMVFVLCGYSAVDAKSPPQKGKYREKEYYSNGNLRFDNIYRNEVLLRKRTFYKNGKRQSEDRYKNGEPYVMRNYYENGRLKSIWTKKSKVTKFYTPAGKLKTIVKDPSQGKANQYKSSYIFSGN